MECEICGREPVKPGDFFIQMKEVVQNEDGTTLINGCINLCASCIDSCYDVSLYTKVTYLLSEQYDDSYFLEREAEYLREKAINEFMKQPKNKNFSVK